jgi:hypothetical protein
MLLTQALNSWCVSDKNQFYCALANKRATLRPSVSVLDRSPSTISASWYNFHSQCSSPVSLSFQSGPFNKVGTHMQLILMPNMLCARNVLSCSCALWRRRNSFNYICTATSVKLAATLFTFQQVVVTENCLTARLTARAYLATGSEFAVDSRHSFLWSRRAKLNFR